MKKIKYIITICTILCSFILASAQTQTLGISQSQSGNTSNSCNVCYTITIQYSISNVAATGTVIVATYPNNILDFCNAPGASVSNSGTITTLTFNLGNLPTSASSVSYQVRFKAGTTCNGTTATLNAKISTTEHPVPLLSSPLTLTAVATEGWTITKYIVTSLNQWYYLHPSTNPLAYYVSVCGSTVDVYYSVRITNSGCINLKNASITDNLPAGATVMGIHTGWPNTAANLVPSTTGPGTVTWNVGNPSYTLDVLTGWYDYYVHLQFPVSQLNTVKCNSATLNGTNYCTNAPKTATSASECITLLGLYPGTACGIFGTPYYYNTYPYYFYFIGCPAWLNISFGQTNQCSSSTTTVNNIGYNTPIPGQMHVDSMRMNAIGAGKYVTITLNTTCGTFTHTFNGPLPAATVNFYAAPFSIPAACVITNFSLTSNMSITGNATQDFGQLYFTILPVAWNTSTVVNPGTTVTMTGATYTTSNGNFTCPQSFVTSAKTAKIETVKEFCKYYTNYNCLNPNDTIIYSIAVRNYGTASFTGGSIRDALPVGLQYVPNSSTFGKYNVYTKCNASNMAGTGITVAHAESSASTNLQWNLPALNASCSAGSDWYVINFKVVVTISAPAGLMVNTENCYDGSSQIVSEYDTWNNSARLYICERKVPLELTKEVSADSIHWDSCISVSPGATVYYKLKVKNPGNVPFSQIRMIDLLPAPFDKQVVNCNGRLSTMPVWLTSALPLGNASIIQYSTNSLPTRGADLNLIPDYTTGCNSAPGWTIYSSIPGIPAAIQNQKAIRIDFGSYSLPAGQTETYVFSAQVPPGAPINSIGWNSFAATASQNTVQTLGAESRNVCVKVIESGCGCIGNFVWADTNGNGLQDSGEPGINGCVITLYDASNNPVGLPHISTFNMSSQPGYYQFCGLTAGTYHIGVTPPAGYMVTSQNSSNPALNSDINPNTNMSANFQFNCQDNNDLDIGLVVDQGCNCKGSHWGEIFITDKPGGTDNPHLFENMPVNKLNRKQIPGNLNLGRNITVPNNPDDDISNPGNHFSMPLNCGKKDTLTLSCNATYHFNANYVCIPASCSSTLITLTTPSGGTTSSSNTISFTTSTSGIYTIKVYGKCGNVVCDSCIFRFRVVCPICPCDYPLGVKPGKKSLTIVNTAPVYALYNQAFNITAPVGVAFTQVRAEVISFNLTSNYNNECIACKNLPYTWGSIYNATDINTSAVVHDSITMGTNPPVIQFTPVPGNTHQNPRETIWENYSGFTLPNSLNMQFVLPHPSMIGCCILNARICVKFTFRDLNCKECEVIVCFTVTIPPAQTHVDTPTGTVQADPAAVVKAEKAGCLTCGTNMVLTGNAGTEQNIPGQGLNNDQIQVPEAKSDEELLKITQEKVNELKKLKENGIKRGDVELLPLLEKRLSVQPEKEKPKK